MGSKVKQLLGSVAPLAGLIPGIGWPVAAALGAGGGLLSGGGLRGALSSGLGAGLLSGGGSALGNFLAGPGTAIGGATGLGASANGIGGALLGAGAGGAKGGLRGALLGGAAGGLGSYANAGGFDGLGESLGLTGENGALTGIGNSLGLGGDTSSAADKAFLNRATLSSQGFSPADANFLTNARSGLDSALSSGAGGGSSAYSGLSNGNSLSSLLGGISSISGNNGAEKDLLSAQRQALSRYQPYVDAKFNPGDLTKDPGYQFRLQQGEQAIGRQQAAKGSYFSGGALKAAEDYGQGLADTTYNDAYNRWLKQNQQNIGVAGSLSDLDQAGGNVRAGAGIANSNAINRSLAGLLGGYGAYSPHSRPYYA